MFVRCACGIVCSVLLSVPAPAKNRLHYHGVLRAACGAEIRSQCGGIPEARGQLLACVYRHQSSLSPRCEGIVWNSMDRLGKALAKDQNVQRYCDVDARQWCKETIAGRGNLVSCFLISQMVISPQCKAAVYSVWDKRPRGGSMNRD
jgi:hypothetical protein